MNDAFDALPLAAVIDKKVHYSSAIISIYKEQLNI